MNIKILEEKDNAILNRKEYSLEIESLDKTPSNVELKKELVSFLKAKEDLIAIKSINQIFGKKTSKAFVYVYKDEKSLKETEPVKKEKQAKPEEKKEEAPKPAGPQPEKIEAPKPEEKAQVESKEAPKEEKKE